MLEGHEDHEDRNNSIINFHNNEFYNAIMDEDLGCIEDVSKKHGRNILIKVQDCMPRKVLWKGLAILPLHLAASYRRVKSMQRLLSTGTDPEMRDQHGRTTLHLVISSWPNILTTRRIPGSKFQSTMTGVQSQAEACLQLLCEHGVNISAEIEGESGQTALHLSVRYAAPSAVQILGSYGANINAVDSSGMTPLHMAAGILHKEIISSLITQGADINMGVKHSGNTPLHLAVVAVAMKTTKTMEDGISCISVLLENGAEPNAENSAGMTPLQEACILGNKELVDLLLRYGANINKLSQAGENCLFLFLNHSPNVSNSSLLVKLISLTSPLTIYNQKGYLPSALMLQCFSKQKEQLLKLIQHPKRLQDICKTYIYLKYIHDKKEEMKILPERLYNFVFNCWENIHNISFVTDNVQFSLNNVSGNIPT